MTLAAGLLATAVALSACSAPQTEVYEVTGIVQTVDPEAEQIKIAHDDIPGFMPAMTMNFDVARPEIAQGVEPGARVRFKLERSATLLRILELEVLDAHAARVSSRPPGPDLDEAPDFELIDQSGEPFRLADLRGKRVLLDFIFTRCPGPCPILSATKVELQRQLPTSTRESVHFVSITLDPEYDTPERLREYARARGADLGHWSFLTGEPERVQDVVRSYHVGTIRGPDGTLDHLVITYLIGPDGRIEERYVGLDHPPSAFLTDLRAP